MNINRNKGKGMKDIRWNYWRRSKRRKKRKKSWKKFTSKRKFDDDFWL